MSNFMQGNTAPNTLASEALKRPARRQPARPVYDSDTSDYNIWYHKKMGTREPRRGPRGSRAATKCVLATDAGYTRADRGGVRQFCIYFARGCCTLGERCLYLHRIPNEQDAAVLGRDLSQDCFGRTRAPDHKDDREGVGSMLRDCRTLFVFYGGAGGRSADDTRELVMDSFQEWGPIRSINVIPTKTIAFVQYYWRCSAEFAKEAMHAQCLKGSGSNEVLSVCWANDDPNPVAVRQVKREREHVFDTAVQNHVESLPEDQKRARLLQEQMAATGAYPDTDAMYGDGAPAAQAASRAAAPCGVPAPQWGQAEELQDDVSRYCADDPYYDQEPEMDPPTAGGGEEEGTGPRADGAAGARESGEAEPPPGDAALQLIAGYGSGDEGSD
eukprot:CAMPEP_0177591826 /NCGR_PEP_ID=MMETSP0419_2-20121207/8217_1 /TAXON_ID=582737 /ORGANISM="Tetraselmis sp., Strain GSL018" /LENGTH=385 /DNA_ID=CAMNT_0019082619 /DNA_START=23 /DNA_END=1181 /DNA_ORIENTATION=+